MKKIASVLLVIVMLLSVIAPYQVFANDYSYADINNAIVHDPSIFRDKDGKYYLVGSHLQMYSSDDMINWDNEYTDENDVQRFFSKPWTEELSEPLKWTTSWQEWRREKEAGYEDKEIEYNCWANDVIYNEHMGKYCLYGAVSVWGATCSVIWLCTSDNINGPYEYVHSFIYTGITKNLSKENPKYNGLPYTNTNIQTDLIEKGLITKTQVNNMPWFFKKDVDRYNDPNDWWYREWFSKNEGGYNCILGMYPNAIDPAPFVDKNGDMWLVYGSYSGGCFVQKLVNETGLPDYEYQKNHQKDGYDIYFGMHVSNTNDGTGGTGEGPYIQYDPVSDYYYFFLTYGGLNSGDGYNIREYRSKNPDGPYLDAAGNDARDMKNTGLQLEGNYKFSSQKEAQLASGHSSCLIDDDNSMYQVYHQRYYNHWDEFNTVIHKMVRTENGWSVMLPFQYQGEKDTDSVTKNEAVGVYEFVFTVNKIQNLGWNDAPWGNFDNHFADLIAPTQTIALNTDGTISNIKAVDYAPVRQREIIEYDQPVMKDINGFVTKDVVGTWSLKNGSTYVNLTIDGVNYSGAFAKQFDETEAKNEVLVFSAAGDNNTSIWGVKNDSHKLVLDCSVASSCTKNGYDVYKCFDCDIILKKYEKPLAKHSYKVKVIEPTCAKGGYTTHTCTACGKAYTDSKTSATGNHIYDAGKETTKATYAKAGVKTFTCKICGKKKTHSIPKLTLAKPASVKVTALSKGFKLSWKKVSASKGYEIQYSTSSKFTSPKKITISKNSTLSRSVTKLTAKKKYYIRIRAYVTENGKKYYSPWASTSVTTKK